MNWVKKKSDYPLGNESFVMDDGIDNEINIQNVCLERVSDNISIIAQLFIANHILYEIPTVLTAIPITNQKIEGIVVNEIAIHFNKIQKIYINKRLERIQFQELKDVSRNRFKDMLKNNLIHPIIKELYFLGEKESLEDRYINIGKRQQVQYEVLKEYVEPSTIIDSDLLHVIWFIKNTFCITEKSFTILPIGWELKDNLKELETLKLFNQMSDSLLITVDSETAKVLYINFVSVDIKM
ncbi:hypothetical protein [Bacillus multifaciens]|uniref:hypothetical protein n=1 Tax=Bacillus multifaciens TaxID=3068506 RepID=UPI002741284D|nr:hypothetical protein [Bacillus sp. WLY-B-L8]MDP7981184.1 hypothetical protein [Bacillus sp. WLY-B-L8]HDX9589324.1 hypothetical protein [Bacillus pseudomycoides]